MSLPDDGKTLMRDALVQLLEEVTADADSKRAVSIALARFSRAVPSDLDYEYVHAVIASDKLDATDRAAFLCALVETF